MTDAGLPPEVPMVAGGRHEARERAVHLLYETRIKDRPVADTLADQVTAPDPYTVELVRGVHDHATELDELIGRLARGWTLERMPSLDLEVLRVATFELAHRPDVPTGVVLSEAVDLAGRYGTDDSSRFVNGVLSSAADELRPPD
jgi:N utilization substance protein B